MSAVLSRKKRCTCMSFPGFGQFADWGNAGLILPTNARNCKTLQVKQDFRLLECEIMERVGLYTKAWFRPIHTYEWSQISGQFTFEHTNNNTCPLTQWYFMLIKVWQFVEQEFTLTRILPLCVVKGDWMGRTFGWDRKNRRPVLTAGVAR
jgi:hypothetical protein